MHVHMLTGYAITKRGSTGYSSFAKNIPFISVGGGGGSGSIMLKIPFVHHNRGYVQLSRLQCQCFSLRSICEVSVFVCVSACLCELWVDFNCVCEYIE